VDDEKRTFSRLATARVLVLVASVVSFAGAALIGLLLVVIGPSVAGLGAGAAAFGGFVLVGAAVANVLAVRARSLKGVVGLGCGTLLACVVVGLGVLLVLISRAG
jgi:hypothetical protein